MGNLESANGRRSIFARGFWRLCLPAAAMMATLPQALSAATLQTTVQPSMGLTYMICTQGTDPSASSAETFTGEIAAFSSDITQPGWVPCDGSSLPVAGNSLLFKTIGNNYGGDGVTNFDLPDLNGRVAIGAGQGVGLTNRNPGDLVGTQQVSLTTANLPVADGGQGQAFTNMQSSETINYIIDTGGIYPSRGVATPLVAGIPTVQAPSSTPSLMASIVPFAGTVAPSGWAFCDGSLIPKDSNLALFSLLGTDFGGDGINTFALPDLRGKAPIGVGQAPGLSEQIIGESSGNESTTLNPNNVVPNNGFVVPYSNMQPTLGLNYIIALQGIFPAQNSAGADALTPDAEGTGEPNIGQISLIATNFAPLGWAFCEGQALPIAENDALFALLGTTYGGNGVTTFDLPDLRGRIIAGADGLTFTPAELTGVEELSLSPSDIANLPEPSSMGILSVAFIFLRRQKRRHSLE